MKQYGSRSPKWLLKLACLFGLCALLLVQAALAVSVLEGALANMPVKEITVFKDGHVFVLHEGKAPTDDNGDVVLDYLPRPIIGTFWAYSANPKVKLSAVVSGKRIVSVDRTALTIRELIEGNVGARVQIKEDTVYEATVVRIPGRTSEELRRTSAPGTEDRLPARGDIVLLKVAEGIKAVPISRIQEVIFLDKPQATVTYEEFRNIMTLKLDRNKRKPEKTADVGMVYVQRGIRWIPNYHVEIDGKGNAFIKLQATLINELADIENVKAHLVIGVPTFAFKDTVDPISLQETVAQLSRHFREDSQTAFAFSNAIMSQDAAWHRIDRRRGRRERDAVDLGPEVTGSLKNEDLYVFTLDHVTLRKGQRMVVPVAEYKLKYRDVFVLDLPFGPPPEVRHRFNSEQQLQLARRMSAPKVVHRIRLTNDSKYPLTTAPALIFREGRIIAQGMTSYTAIGAEGDLELTTAVDISAERVDKETERTPNAVTWLGNRYSKTDMRGDIKLTNRREDKVYLEVTRSILGLLDSANNDGVVEQLGWHEGGWMSADGFPFWWYWHSWPYWWYHFNGIGRITWKFELEPGKSIDLEYRWHYFWRQ
jgi:hypothetical protein